MMGGIIQGTGSAFVAAQAINPASKTWSSAAEPPVILRSAIQRSTAANTIPESDRAYVHLQLTNHWRSGCNVSDIVTDLN